jgi:hypothetical protein
MKRRTGGIVATILTVALMPACAAGSYPQMICSGEQRQNLLHLVAQAVPSAILFPCIERLTPGWSYGGSEVRSGYVHFWLDSDRVGTDAVDVTMTAACDVAGDTVMRVPTGDARLLLYLEPDAEHPTITVRHYVATGACTTVRFSFTRQTAPTEFTEAQALLGYQLRSDYVEAIRRETGLTLCGAEAPPCPG